jgi:hypothetical protein
LRAEKETFIDGEDMRIQNKNWISEYLKWARELKLGRAEIGASDMKLSELRKHLKYVERWRGILHSILNVMAVFSIWLDTQILSLSKRIYSLLPNKLKRMLCDLNRSYLGYRNKIMKIEMDSPSTYRRADERGDVPGWVLVVLMTTGLVTALWTIAAPRLSQILKNSLDSMNNIR